MTRVYGTGAYDFKRHHVAEYPVELPHHLADKPVESKPGSNLPSSITLLEIQRDRLTKIAAANWMKTGDSTTQGQKPFDPELVKDIYETELSVKSGAKPVPLQRVMILEVSQYLENYLWPNFDPETATFEHVMSMILMVNEKFRENVAAWMCFYDRKDMFKGFLERVIQLKEGRDLSIAEKTNYLVFMINAFQMEGSLAKELYAETLQLSRIELGPESTSNKQTDSAEDSLSHGDEPLWDDASDEELNKTFDLNREWQKRHDQFHTIGYRDGLTARKEASAQEGFNIGFKQSVLVGYNWGLVRGVTSALACLPDGLKERLIKRQEDRNKFQNLHESVHSISTSDALKLFHNDIMTNNSVEQKGKAEATAVEAGLQEQNSKCGHLENYYEELKSLLAESPAIEVHSMEGP